MSIYTLTCDRCNTNVAAPKNLKICSNSMQALCYKCAKEVTLFQCRGCRKYFQPSLIDRKSRHPNYCAECAPLLEDLSYQWVSKEDNEEYCLEYAATEYTDFVKSYSSDPLNYLNFMGNPKDGLHYGIELELQTYNQRRTIRGELRELAGKLIQHSAGYAILKSDSSIIPGVELVTAPATLEVHRDLMVYTLEKLPFGVADATKKCGLHIHVSRNPLSLLTIGKLLVFFNNPDNRREIDAIAGRTESEYAKFNSNKKIKDALQGACSQIDRREAINLYRPNTIEFRIFASSLDAKTVMERLDFVASTIDYCRNVAGIQQLGIADYRNWLHSLPKRTYPYLRGFFDLTK